LMAFDLREETRWTVPRRLGSAIMMGVAVSAMHYTGMAAASFIPASPPNLSHAVSISAVGSNAIVIVTWIVLLAALVTSSVDRRANAEIQGLNQELERRVTERTSQLTAINEELRKEIADRQRVEEALQEAQVELARITRVLAMGELVASIAHEINQPLAAIVMNTNFSLCQLASSAPNLQEVKDAIEDVAEDATRIKDVISRLRSLFQKGAPDMVALDINDVIQEVLVLLRNEAARNHVQVRLDLAAGLPRVLGDRVQLQQVLINLVLNAIDAMRAVNHRPRDLDIKTARHADGVLIQVQDSGIGLDPDRVDRVFEPFYTTKPHGIGMGLSISRSIIESHGGCLWAESGSPGALIQFTLPIAIW
jgi:C4-dicarboxylate-specific signal transduction histidine kinase